MTFKKHIWSRFLLLSFATLMVCASEGMAFGDPSTFDLNGPKLEVKVTRGGKTLPITEVPNLAVGDKLWIHPDFPEDQAVRYLLVAAFLRGATNIPPEKWFHRADTWSRRFDSEGLTITVPAGAQQVLLFLAPETGGDFKTLMGAVRGRPGAFVRASQDLNQASLDRSRLDAYLDAVRKVNATEPEKLKEVSPLLARSLDVKIDPVCLNKDIDEIAPCLTEKGDALVLDDGHSMSIVQALTSGPAGDLALQAAYTPPMNSGYYSPYIASVIDIARIMDSFHTAEYQYIPALAEQSGEALALKLNTPPSFHNPKSVLVIALPAVESAQPPPLHPVDEKQVFCAQNATLALPVDGAPLVFSTSYARNLTLHLQAASGKSVDLPLRPDAVRGGLSVDTKPLAGTVVGAEVKASVRGDWGFEPFAGPVVHLQGAHEQRWKIADADQNALVVGRDDTLHLEADEAGCVDGVQFRSADGKQMKAAWKLVKPNQVEVTLPLKDAQPGAMTLLVNQSGLAKPEDVAVHTFAQAGHLTSFTLHAGDRKGVLAGTRLDEVARLTMKGIEFAPGTLTSAHGADSLEMETVNAKAASALKVGETLPATAKLRDGRTVDVMAKVDAARPSATLISKSVEADNESGDAAASNIQLSDQNELPQNARLLFSLKAQIPARFSREEKIEVATDDGSYSALLTLANGLTLQDAHTALATLDPAKEFGASAFGPLEFRVVAQDGVKGDWQPLAMLVRLPRFQSLQCGEGADSACKLKGSGLFLVDSISQNQQFVNPVQVPDGFAGRVLPVPHPDAGGQLYVKLRDDPSVVNLVTLTPEIVEAKNAAKQQAAAKKTEKFRPEYVSPDGSAGSAAASQPASPTTQAPAPDSGQTPPAAPPQASEASGASTAPGTSGSGKASQKPASASPAPSQPATPPPQR
ncbi:MAG TPA: hypothetical protein VFW25_12065 [Silvibacterium sp.]|nr:hypothetical protein [Silvibacterium sp.]